MPLSDEHKKKLMERANSLIENYYENLRQSNASETVFPNVLQKGLIKKAQELKISLNHDIESEIRTLGNAAIEEFQQRKEKKEAQVITENVNKDEMLVIEDEYSKRENMEYTPRFQELKMSEEKEESEEKIISLFSVEPPPKALSDKPIENLFEEEFESEPFFSVSNPQNQPNITSQVKSIVLLDELKKYLYKDRHKHPYKLKDQYGISEILAIKDPNVQKFRINSIADTSCKVSAKQEGSSLWYRAKINNLSQNEQRDIIEKICRLAVKAAPIGTTFDLTNTPLAQEDMVYQALENALKLSGVDQNKINRLIIRRADAPSSSASSSSSFPHW